MIFKVVMDIINFIYLCVFKGILFKIVKIKYNPNFKYNVTYF